MKKKNILRIAGIFLAAVAALCGFLFAKEYISAQKEISEYDNLQSAFTTTIQDNIHESSGDSSSPGNISETDGLPYILTDFEALLLKNPDTVGWLSIPDTGISYPVVQAKDNNKYLDLSFEGRQSGAGTPFADAGNDMRNLDTVTVIYGHNMGAGRNDMFGQLLSYKAHEYFMRHRYIRFDTVWQKHDWWKVFAVLEHDIRSEDFNYMEKCFTDEKDFMDWITKARELSQHDGDDTDIRPDGHILVLSTCDRSRYGRNGRLLVLAVNIA